MRPCLAKSPDRKYLRIAKIPMRNRILFATYRTFMRLFGSAFDHRYLDSHVPLSRIASHKNHMRYLSDVGNHTGKSILEIGSREVTGKSMAKELFSDARYVGFDYYPGNNVDIVGDAHRLSEYLRRNHSISFSPAPASSTLRCRGS